MSCDIYNIFGVDADRKIKILTPAKTPNLFPKDNKINLSKTMDITNENISMFAILVLKPCECSNCGILLKLIDIEIKLEIIFDNNPKCSSVTIKSGRYSNRFALQYYSKDKPVVLYLTYHKNYYLTLFLNGEVLDFIKLEAESRENTFEVATYNNESKELETEHGIHVYEIVSGQFIPTFKQRYMLHRYFEKKYGISLKGYPVFQHYHQLIKMDGRNVRDPSEILHIGDRFYIYFTVTPFSERDGFRGIIFVSSCPDTSDPSVPDNWSKPVEVIQKGNYSEHDGTGCFTPDCYYDGENIFVFYTGLNSTHPKGFPQWPDLSNSNAPKEPEHIMVARSSRPDGGFQKTPKYTKLYLNRKLQYSEATVPGGYAEAYGKKLYDVSLIDHGQCWRMDDGERRYYYKGGGGCEKHHGEVCVVRGLDENWLNGYRHDVNPIISEGSHMEGILITRVEDTLFLQLQIFGQKIGRWVTYVSDAKDGIHWTFVDGGHWVKPGNHYPLSIGVCNPLEPQWGIGQFQDEDGSISLAYLKVL